MTRVAEPATVLKVLKVLQDRDERIGSPWAALARYVATRGTAGDRDEGNDANGANEGIGKGR